MSNRSNFMTPPRALAIQIKEEARALGFDLCHVASLAALQQKSTPDGAAPDAEFLRSEFLHTEFYEGWLTRGSAADMGYLARNVEKRRDPRLLAEGGEAFRSAVVLGVDYHQFDLPPALRDDPSRGIVASYAWGDDYHEIIRPLLYELDGTIRKKSGRTTQGKCLVDTGPVLERDWAMRAGLGFTGKNCCTIHPQLGSWLLLAVIFVPEELPPGPPPQPTVHLPLSTKAALDGATPDAHFASWQFARRQPTHDERRMGGEESGALESAGVSGTCGACTRCLVACPTDAFVGPFHLDPRRCISYWTIETQKAVPRALRSHFGNRIFGCDICQEVCPWNGRLPERTPLLDGLRAQQERVAPPLLEGFAPENPYWLVQEAFSARFRRSPIKRAKRRGMLRNVCTALGNWGAVEAVDALTLALSAEEAVVRVHAAWALGEVMRRANSSRAADALRGALPGELESNVREEMQFALNGRAC